MCVWRPPTSNEWCLFWSPHQGIVLFSHTIVTLTKRHSRHTHKHMFFFKSSPSLPHNNLSSIDDSSVNHQLQNIFQLEHSSTFISRHCALRALLSPPYIWHTYLLFIIKDLWIPIFQWFAIYHHLYWFWRSNCSIFAQLEYLLWAFRYKSCCS